MRILFVTRDKFPPFRPAAAAIFQGELVSRGHEIDWVLQAATPQKSSVQSFGSGIAYIGENSGGTTRIRRAISQLHDFRNYFRVFKLIRHKRYDIVQVKDHYAPAIVTLMACKLYQVPFCYWLAYPHAEDSLYKSRENITKYRWYYVLRGNLWQFLLYKVILPSAVHVFVQSEQMKRDICVHGIPADKMTAVPGSIHLASIPFERPQQSLPEVKMLGDSDVLYLGTLSRVRHLDFLIRVFAKIAKARMDSKLYMLGGADEIGDDEFLVAEARKLGILDRVVFTGRLPMEVAWEYIRKAAVCVSPYYPTMILNSTSPTKLVEYMAMAKPTVGNDHPEQKLVIEESGAGICVPYNEVDFANAVLHLLNDPQMAKDMGRKGRTYVEKYRTNEVIADIVETRYVQIQKEFGSASL